MDELHPRLTGIGRVKPKQESAWLASAGERAACALPARGAGRPEPRLVWRKKATAQKGGGEGGTERKNRAEADGLPHGTAYLLTLNASSVS